MCNWITFKINFTPESLEELGADEIELYTQSIYAMKNSRLAEQLDAAIARENYEHAAMVHDEINRRKLI